VSSRRDNPNSRRLMALSIDAAIVVASYYIALSFRFAGAIPSEFGVRSRDLLMFALLAVLVHLMANELFAVYTIVTRYVGLSQALNIVKAVSLSVAILFAIDWVAPSRMVPLSVVLAGGMIAVVGLVGVRFYGRMFHERSLANLGVDRRRLLIVGAGRAADMILREVARNPGMNVRVVGLVDDDVRLQGMRLQNVSVLGVVQDVPEVVRDRDIDEILIAIPSATAAEMNRIYGHCLAAEVPVKTLPPLTQMVDGSASLADARSLNIDDLLGRPPVRIDSGAIAAYLRHKRVLVTGAGGSIGSELSRQIAQFEPDDLVLVDRDESALYSLHEDLRVSGFDRYRLLPANVGRRQKMERIFAKYRPQVVFHAAAFKHVPLMETSPDEAVLNNVKGTLVVAETAALSGVERIVNISTDKAVDPVNVMGATKRVGEQVMRMLSSRHPDTLFASVRFGNVLGSRGSVIPIFQKQIENGGPVTVTDPQMTRYFMTIEEAVQLVLQAASMVEQIPTEDGRYGAFVLEMGNPVRILDVAHQMIRLLGGGRNQNIAIEFTGLRPGEKLHETLVCRGEYEATTSHPLIRMARLSRIKAGDAAAGLDERGLPDGFEENLDTLIRSAENHADQGVMVAALQACVPTYEPFDWTQVGAFPGIERETAQAQTDTTADPTKPNLRAVQ
jgi:FlaA1/EpsC-like NDP-sugar epimerase